MSTPGSVPDVPSTALSAGAFPNPPINELIDAAEALAESSVVRERRAGVYGTEVCEHCMFCLRESVGGALNHGASCKVGRVMRAIADIQLRRRGCVCHLGQQSCPLHGEVAKLPAPTEADALWMGTREAWRGSQPERRTVCGAHYLGKHDPAHPITCDREIGHDVDIDSTHFNREVGLSWPTMAKIAAEAKVAQRNDFSEVRG